MDKIPDDLLVVGTIGAPFGVRGWLKIHSFTDPVSNILEYLPWQIKQGERWRDIKLLAGREHGKGIVAQLEGIADRDRAMEFRGVQIAIARIMLPELDSKEVYWSELVGMEVKNLQDEQIGRIDDVFETGANDVIVVAKQGQKEPILIPYVLERYVISIDKSSRVVIVDWQLDY
jgi:16S rRNA processing protein RimM